MQLRTRHWILATVAAGLLAFGADSAKVMMEAAHKKEVVDGDLKGAIREYGAIAAKYKSDRAVTAMALVHMAECYSKMGDGESRKIYEQVVREFGDQKEAVALARTHLGRNPEMRNDGMVSRQVWSVGPRYQIVNSTPSPDGLYVPFVRLGEGSLGLHNVASGEDRMLTSGGGRSQSPVFMPDGKRILYGWRGSGELCELRIIDIDGSNMRTVANIHGSCGPGPVSPDGKVVAIDVAGEVAHQISLVNLATGQRTGLKSLDWGYPILGNFSPDGKRLVYSTPISRDSHDREVYSIAVDGSSETRLVSAPGWHDRPFYTPDGSRVVFNSDRAGIPHKWDLWSQRIVGDKAEGKPTLVKAEIGDVWLLGFARDSSLFFAEQTDESDAYVMEMDPSTWHVKGAPKRASDRFIGSTQTALWSPNGQSLAYQSTKSPYPNVKFIVRGVDAQEEREFSVRFNNTYLARYFRWFPDNRSLLLVDDRKDLTTFRRLDTATGEIQPLFEAKTNSQGLNTPAISSDGRGVYYATYDRPMAPKVTNTAHVVRHDLQTGEDKILLNISLPQIPVGNSFLFFSVSPDDRHVAFYSWEGGGGISVIPLSGGAPRELWRISTDRLISTKDPFVWTPDSRGVLLNVVHRRGEKGQWHLSYLPLEGGEPREIGVSGADQVQQLVTAVHPNGRFVAFTEHTLRGGLWIMKNLFQETRAAR